MPTNELIELDPNTIVVRKGRIRQDIGDIEGLANSIREIGQQNPVIVYEEGDYYVLVSGYRRTLSCIYLDRPVLARVVPELRDDLSYRLAEFDENVRRKQMSWQEETIALSELHDMFSADNLKWTQEKTAKTTGYSPATITMARKLAEFLKDTKSKYWTISALRQAYRTYFADRKKKIKAAMAAARANDVSTVDADGVLEADIEAIYNRYSAQLFNADALGFLDELEDESIWCLCTDPPFGIDVSDTKKGSVDELWVDDAGSYLELFEALIPKMFRVLKPNSFGFLFFGYPHYCKLVPWLAAAGFAVDPKPCVWHRTKHSQAALNPDKLFASAHEDFLFFRKGQPILSLPGRTNVLAHPAVFNRSKTHPSEKPIELMVDLLERVSRPGEVVLDPFAGSASTLVAAENLGMIGIGCELDPDWHIAGVQRLVMNAIEQLTKPKKEQRDE